MGIILFLLSSFALILFTIGYALWGNSSTQDKVGYGVVAGLVLLITGFAPLAMDIKITVHEGNVIGSIDVMALVICLVLAVVRSRKLRKMRALSASR